MTLPELVLELNSDLKASDAELTRSFCYDAIRKRVSGASKMTDLQLLLLATIVTNKREFQEKVFIEFLDNSN